MSAPMEWTRERPTRPGFYLVLDPLVPENGWARDLDVRFLYLDADFLVRHLPSWGDEGGARLWLGPLPLPVPHSGDSP